MNKLKYGPTDYLAFYNSALAAYANTVLGANALMLGYTIAATRTVLRATALATPVATAAVADLGASPALPLASQRYAELAQDELARIEATLYVDDTQSHSAESPVAGPIETTSPIEPTAEMLETSVSPHARGTKRAGTRRRRGKK